MKLRAEAHHTLLITWCLSILIIASAGCTVADGPGGTPRPQAEKTQVAGGGKTSNTEIPATPTTYVSPTPAPTLEPPDWVAVAPGISRVYLPVPTPDSDTPSYFYVLRIDPQKVDFKVIYDPDEPHTVEEWGEVTEAPIVFNSGFFSGSFTPNGRIVSDGTVYGTPLDYGNDSIGVRGMFAVTDHRAEIYTMGRNDYNPQGLRFDQAVEAYPMLVLPGGQPAFPEDTHKRARRTVIGLDHDNQVIVIVSDIPLYSLYELAEWASISNLGLDSALNLDGGRSTGIMVSLPNEEKLINSYVPVPIVIAIYLPE